MVCGDTPLARGRYERIALVAETGADARDVMVEGESGLLAVHPRSFRPLYQSSKRRVTWPNGAIATLYNATEPDQLRGPQHDFAWSDELAKWAYAQETWDQLQFGLRLGVHPRQIVTTTPRPIQIVRDLVKRDGQDVVVTRGRTLDNRANLAPSFIANIMNRYQGTRLGRQELNAEILDEIPGAMWTRAMFDVDGFRRSRPDGMSRIVVAIDPSGARGADDDAADSIGIVVAGIGNDGRFYILADLTCRLSPAGWGRVAVQAYFDFKADRIIAERNFGGAMVDHVIHTIDRNVPYREVTASRGKAIRAEPIASLYEQNRVSHVGPADQFELLEAQMCAMTPNGYLGEGSPDRLDAAVWAMQDLMEAKRPLIISDAALAAAAQPGTRRR